MVRRYKVKSIDAVDWEKTPLVEGKILNLEPMMVDDEERLTMIIDTGQTQVRVWQSKALDDAFTLGEVGDSIRIEFKGKVPLKGSKTFNRFSVAVWTGEDDEAENQTQEKADSEAEG